MPELKNSGTHWTDRSSEDLLFQISADFIRQLEKAMEETDVSQAELAERLQVSESRVSQILNNPGNLTLRKIVEYARALNHKVALVNYRDGDTAGGPVSGEIFSICWGKLGKPADFFALTGTGLQYVIVPSSWFGSGGGQTGGYMVSHASTQDRAGTGLVTTELRAHANG